MKYILTLAFVVWSLTIFSQNTFKITDFGAVGDGETLSTSAIQTAIDKAYDNGGGTVIIPAGQFLTATIFLKSNVSLFLESGAVLKGTPEMEAYKTKALVYAKNQHNISVSGLGTIDGQGDHKNFHSKDVLNGITGRPPTIFFSKCNNVNLNDFTLKNGACWCIVIRESNFITVDKIKVRSRVVANNDGLDICDCHNVTVSNSYFDCGDDAICPKSDSKLGVENLTITNCIMKSESNGIKFGTGSIGCFRNVCISNCTIYDTRLSGIALEVVDGATMENISIGNITMDRVNGGIFIKLGQRHGDTPGILRNIKIHDVIATGIGLWQPDTTNEYYKVPKGSPLIGMSVLGLPGYEVENLTLSNIYLQFAGGGTSDDAVRKIKDTPTAYPEYTNAGITPAYGVNIKNAKTISLNNIHVQFIEEDQRPAFYLQNVQDADLSQLKMDVSLEAKSIIKLEDVKDCSIYNCTPTKTQASFLEFSGKITDVSLLNNDLGKVKQTYISNKKSNVSGIKLKN